MRTKILVILAVLCIAMFTHVSAQEVLTNSDIIEMHEAGLPASLIIAKINSTRGVFDTTVDSLVSLSKAGVPSDVITAMTTAGTPAQPPPVQQVQQSGQVNVGRFATAQPNAPAMFTDPHCPYSGVFFDARDGPVAIEPSSFMGARTGGMWKAALSSGLTSIKSRSQINGLRSNNRISGSSPTFYFCFEETQTGLSFETSGATTPNQFLLVVLEPKKKQKAREIVTGKIGGISGGGYSGPPPKFRRDFASERIAPGVYKVTVNGLSPGEYAFFYTGSSATSGALSFGLVNSGGGGGKLFDFSVG